MNWSDQRLQKITKKPQTLTEKFSKIIATRLNDLGGGNQPKKSLKKLTLGKWSVIKNSRKNDEEKRQKDYSEKFNGASWNLDLDLFNRFAVSEMSSTKWKASWEWTRFLSLSDRRGGSCERFLRRLGRWARKTSEGSRLISVWVPVSVLSGRWGTVERWKMESNEQSETEMNKRWTREKSVTKK